MEITGIPDSLRAPPPKGNLPTRHHINRYDTLVNQLNQSPGMASNQRHHIYSRSLTTLGTTHANDYIVAQQLQSIVSVYL